MVDMWIDRRFNIIFNKEVNYTIVLRKYFCIYTQVNYITVTCDIKKIKKVEQYGIFFLVNTLVETNNN